MITHMSEQDCVNSLNGLMEVLANEAITHEFSVTPNLSISIGLAMRTARTESPDSLYGEADRALYTAKRNGRNRLVVFER